MMLLRCFSNSQCLSERPCVSVYRSTVWPLHQYISLQISVLLYSWVFLASYQVSLGTRLGCSVLASTLNPHKSLICWHLASPPAEFLPLQRKCEWEAVHTIQWHVSLVGMVRNWQTSCNFICQRSTVWANHNAEYIFCLAFATGSCRNTKKDFHPDIMDHYIEG